HSALDLEIALGFDPEIEIFELEDLSNEYKFADLKGKPLSVSSREAIIQIAPDIKEERGLTLILGILAGAIKLHEDLTIEKVKLGEPEFGHVTMTVRRKESHNHDQANDLTLILIASFIAISIIVHWLLLRASKVSEKELVAILRRKTQELTAERVLRDELADLSKWRPISNPRKESGWKFYVYEVGDFFVHVPDGESSIESAEIAMANLGERLVDTTKVDNVILPDNLIEVMNPINRFPQRHRDLMIKNPKYANWKPASFVYVQNKIHPLADLDADGMRKGKREIHNGLVVAESHKNIDKAKEIIDDYFDLLDEMWMSGIYNTDATLINVGISSEGKVQFFDLGVYTKVETEDQLRELVGLKGMQLGMEVTTLFNNRMTDEILALREADDELRKYYAQLADERLNLLHILSQYREGRKLYFALGRVHDAGQTLRGKRINDEAIAEFTNDMSWFKARTSRNVQLRVFRNGGNSNQAALLAEAIIFISVLVALAFTRTVRAAQLAGAKKFIILSLNSHDIDEGSLLDEIFDVKAEAFRYGTVDDPDFMAEQRIEDIRLIRSVLFDEKADILIAASLEHTEKIAGFAIVLVAESMAKPFAGLALLAVRPQFQGMGIGQGLLNKAASWALEHGLDEIRLSIDDSPVTEIDNPLGFYKKAIKRNQNLRLISVIPKYEALEQFTAIRVKVLEPEKEIINEAFINRFMLTGLVFAAAALTVEAGLTVIIASLIFFGIIAIGLNLIKSISEINRARGKARIEDLRERIAAINSITIITAAESTDSSSIDLATIIMMTVASSIAAMVYVGRAGSFSADDDLRTPLEKEKDRENAAVAIRRLYHSSATELVVALIRLQANIHAVSMEISTHLDESHNDASQWLNGIWKRFSGLFSGKGGLNQLHNDVKIGTGLINPPTHDDIISWQRRFDSIIEGFQELRRELELVLVQYEDIAEIDDKSGMVLDDIDLILDMLASSRNIFRGTRKVQLISGGHVAEIAQQARIMAEIREYELIAGEEVNDLIVNVDPMELENVISNIKTNAQEAAERAGFDGGELKISMAIAREGRYLVVYVLDNGPGINKSGLARSSYDAWPHITALNVSGKYWRRDGSYGMPVNEFEDLHGLGLAELRVFQKWVGEEGNRTFQTTKDYGHPELHRLELLINVSQGIRSAVAEIYQLLSDIQNDISQELLESEDLLSNLQEAVGYFDRAGERIAEFFAGQKIPEELSIFKEFISSSIESSASAIRDVMQGKERDGDFTHNEWRAAAEAILGFNEVIYTARNLNSRERISSGTTVAVYLPLAIDATIKHKNQSSSLILALSLIASVLIIGMVEALMNQREQSGVNTSWSSNSPPKKLSFVNLEDKSQAEAEDKISDLDFGPIYLSEASDLPVYYASVSSERIIEEVLLENAIAGTLTTDLMHKLAEDARSFLENKVADSRASYIRRKLVRSEFRNFEFRAGALAVLTVIQNELGLFSDEALATVIKSITEGEISNFHKGLSANFKANDSYLKSMQDAIVYFLALAHETGHTLVSYEYGIYSNNQQAASAGEYFGDILTDVFAGIMGWPLEGFRKFVDYQDDYNKTKSDNWQTTSPHAAARTQLKIIEEEVAKEYGNIDWKDYLYIGLTLLRTVRDTHQSISTPPELSDDLMLQSFVPSTLKFKELVMRHVYQYLNNDRSGALPTRREMSQETFKQASVTVASPEKIRNSFRSVIPVFVAKRNSSPNRNTSRPDVIQTAALTDNLDQGKESAESEQPDDRSLELAIITAAWGEGREAMTTADSKNLKAFVLDRLADWDRLLQTALDRGMLKGYNIGANGVFSGQVEEMLGFVNIHDIDLIDLPSARSAAGKVLHADINQGLPIPDNHLDFVIAAHIFEHVDRDNLAEEVNRVLNDGGRAFVVLHHLDSAYFGSKPVVSTESNYQSSEEIERDMAVVILGIMNRQGKLKSRVDLDISSQAVSAAARRLGLLRELFSALFREKHESMSQSLTKFVYSVRTQLIVRLLSKVRDKVIAQNSQGSAQENIRDFFESKGLRVIEIELLRRFDNDLHPQGRELAWGVILEKNLTTEYTAQNSQVLNAIVLIILGIALIIGIIKAGKSLSERRSSIRGQASSAGGAAGLINKVAGGSFERLPNSPRGLSTTLKITFHLGLLIGAAKMSIHIAYILSSLKAFLPLTVLFALKVFIPSLLVLLAVFYLWRDYRSYQEGRQFKWLYIGNTRNLSLNRALAIREFQQERLRKAGVKPLEGFSDQGIKAVFTQFINNPVSTVAFILGALGIAVTGGISLLSWPALKAVIFGLLARYLLNILWNFFWNYMAANDALQKIADDYENGKLSAEDKKKIDTLEDRISRSRDLTDGLEHIWYQIQGLAVRFRIYWPALSGALMFLLGRLQLVIIGSLIAESLVPFLGLELAVYPIFGETEFQALAGEWELPVILGGVFRTAVIVLGLKLVSSNFLRTTRDIENVFIKDQIGTLDANLIWQKLDELDKVKDPSDSDKVKAARIKQAIAVWLGRDLIYSFNNPGLVRLLKERLENYGAKIPDISDSEKLQYRIGYHFIPAVIAAFMIITSWIIIPLAAFYYYFLVSSGLVYSKGFARKYPLTSIWLQKAKEFMVSFWHMSLIGAEIKAVIDSGGFIAEHPLFEYIGGREMGEIINLLEGGEKGAISWGSQAMALVDPGSQITQGIHNNIANVGNLLGFEIEAKDLRSWENTYQDKVRYHTYKTRSDFRQALKELEKADLANEVSGEVLADLLFLASKYEDLEKVLYDQGVINYAKIEETVRIAKGALEYEDVREVVESGRRSRLDLVTLVAEETVKDTDKEITDKDIRFFSLIVRMNFLFQVGLVQSSGSNFLSNPLLDVLRALREDQPTHDQGIDQGEARLIEPETLKEHVRNIAIPRPAYSENTEGASQVSAYIQEQLQSYGLEPRLQKFTMQEVTYHRSVWTSSVYFRTKPIAAPRELQDSSVEIVASEGAREDLGSDFGQGTAKDLQDISIDLEELLPYLEDVTPMLRHSQKNPLITEAENIIVTIPGVDHPEKKIVLGAHYDAYNGVGANDNATGVAALLEAARILSKSNFEYTIEIVFFTAEEDGDVGSKFYLEQMSEQERANIVAAFVVDMIGDNKGHKEPEGQESLDLMHDRSRPEVSKELIRQTTLAIELAIKGLEVKISLDSGYDSDDDEFQRLGIPTVFIAEDTAEELYKENEYFNGPGDIIDHIDFEGFFPKAAQAVIEAVKAQAKATNFAYDQASAIRQTEARVEDAPELAEKNPRGPPENQTSDIRHQTSEFGFRRLESLGLDESARESANKFVQPFKNELLQLASLLKSGRINQDNAAEILMDIIAKHTKGNEAQYDIRKIFDTAEGNCISLSQFYLILAEEIGLKAYAIDTSEPTARGQREGHAAVLVILGGQKVMIIDLGINAKVNPFDLNEIYTKKNNHWQAKVADKANPYRRLRILSDKSIQAVVLVSEAYALSQRGEINAAITLLEDEAVKLDANYALLYTNLGRNYGALDRHEQAEENFRKAIKADPGYISAYADLGISLANQGRLREAVKYLEKAIELDNEYIHAHLILGQIYKSLGDKERSSQHLEKAKQAVQEQQDNFRDNHSTSQLGYEEAGSLSQVGSPRTAESKDLSIKDRELIARTADSNKSIIGIIPTLDADGNVQSLTLYADGKPFYTQGATQTATEKGGSPHTGTLNPNIDHWLDYDRDGKMGIAQSFNDKNRNGIQDAGEETLGDLVILLDHYNGNTIILPERVLDVPGVARLLNKYYLSKGLRAWQGDMLDWYKRDDKGRSPNYQDPQVRNLLIERLEKMAQEDSLHRFLLGFILGNEPMFDLEGTGFTFEQVLPALTALKKAIEEGENADEIKRLSLAVPGSNKEKGLQSPWIDAYFYYDFIAEAVKAIHQASPDKAIMIGNHEARVEELKLIKYILDKEGVLDPAYLVLGVNYYKDNNFQGVYDRVKEHLAIAVLIKEFAWSTYIKEDFYLEWARSNNINDLPDMIKAAASAYDKAKETLKQAQGLYSQAQNKEEKEKIKEEILEAYEAYLKSDTELWLIKRVQASYLQHRLNQETEKEKIKVLELEAMRAAEEVIGLAHEGDIIQSFYNRAGFNAGNSIGYNLFRLARSFYPANPEEQFINSSWEADGVGMTQERNNGPAETFDEDFIGPIITTGNGYGRVLSTRSLEIISEINKWIRSNNQVVDPIAYDLPDALPVRGPDVEKRAWELVPQYIRQQIMPVIDSGDYARAKILLEVLIYGKASSAYRQLVEKKQSHVLIEQYAEMSEVNRRAATREEARLELVGRNNSMAQVYPHLDDRVTLNYLYARTLIALGQVDEAREVIKDTIELYSKGMVWEHDARTSSFSFSPMEEKFKTLPNNIYNQAKQELEAAEKAFKEAQEKAREQAQRPQVVIPQIPDEFAVFEEITNESGLANGLRQLGIALRAEQGLPAKNTDLNQYCGVTDVVGDAAYALKQINQAIKLRDGIHVEEFDINMYFKGRIMWSSNIADTTRGLVPGVLQIISKTKDNVFLEDGELVKTYSIYMERGRDQLVSYTRGWGWWSQTFHYRVQTYGKVYVEYDGKIRILPSRSALENAVKSAANGNSATFDNAEAVEFNDFNPSAKAYRVVKKDGTEFTLVLLIERNDIKFELLSINQYPDYLVKMRNDLLREIVKGCGTPGHQEHLRQLRRVFEQLLEVHRRPVRNNDIQFGVERKREDFASKAINDQGQVEEDTIRVAAEADNSNTNRRGSQVIRDLKNTDLDDVARVRNLYSGITENTLEQRGAIDTMARLFTNGDSFMILRFNDDWSVYEGVIKEKGSGLRADSLFMGNESDRTIFRGEDGEVLVLTGEKDRNGFDIARVMTDDKLIAWFKAGAKSEDASKYGEDIGLRRVYNKDHEEEEVYEQIFFSFILNAEGTYKEFKEGLHEFVSTKYGDLEPGSWFFGRRLKDKSSVIQIEDGQYVIFDSEADPKKDNGFTRQYGFKSLTDLRKAIINRSIASDGEFTGIMRFANDDVQVFIRFIKEDDKWVLFEGQIEDLPAKAERDAKANGEDFELKFKEEAGYKYKFLIEPINPRPLRMVEGKLTASFMETEVDKRTGLYPIVTIDVSTTEKLFKLVNDLVAGNKLSGDRTRYQGVKIGNKVAIVELDTKGNPFQFVIQKIDGDPEKPYIFIVIGDISNAGKIINNQISLMDDSRTVPATGLHPIVDL
ncbi:MAG: M20/M25/M40 family metallo-hydrolase, partial [Candidatus Omnitrophica bacterium]|nr:M20/M25/M40 family metallo-hydrolase [Candidatus Omnitrophota bacterium]